MDLDTVSRLTEDLTDRSIDTIQYPDLEDRKLALRSFANCSRYFIPPKGEQRPAVPWVGRIHRGSMPFAFVDLHVNALERRPVVHNEPED